MCSGPTGRCYLHWINKMFQSHSSWWNCTLVWFSMWKTIYRSGKTFNRTSKLVRVLKSVFGLGRISGCQGFLQKSWTGSEQGQPNRTGRVSIENIKHISVLLCSDLRNDRPSRWNSKTASAELFGRRWLSTEFSLRNWSHFLTHQNHKLFSN